MIDESKRRKPEDSEAGGGPLNPPVFLRVSRTDLSRTELEKRAARVGTVAGKAVSLFREVRRRLQEESRRKSGDRFRDLRREAAERAREWRRSALERTAELRRQARSGIETARARANQVGRDYPVHVVAAAGVIGLALGVGFRIWRAKRAR